MTLKEAGEAALKNLSVVYESPLDGAILCGRIGCIRKDFALKSDVARGKPEAVYALELLPMNRAKSVLTVDPERVRLATAEDMRDISQYQSEPVMPVVHTEMLCQEYKERNL